MKLNAKTIIIFFLIIGLGKLILFVTNSHVNQVSAKKENYAQCVSSLSADPTLQKINAEGLCGCLSSLKPGTPEEPKAEIVSCYDSFAKSYYLDYCDTQVRPITEEQSHRSIDCECFYSTTTNLSAESIVHKKNTDYKTIITQALQACNIPKEN